jgi:hypothetical protein
MVLNVAILFWNLNTSSETKTKTAYTQDGINFISKERLEQNIKLEVAKSSDYREVQVPLDTFVLEASPETGET